MGEREPGGDVEEAVPQAFRFGFGELAVKAECLGPDDQVVREHHDLGPHLVQSDALNENLARPVSLSSRMRSSTCAC